MLCFFFFFKLSNSKNSKKKKIIKSWPGDRPIPGELNEVIQKSVSYLIYTFVAKKKNNSIHLRLLIDSQLSLIKTSFYHRVGVGNKKSS